MTSPAESRLPLAVLAAILPVFVWSGIHPRDLFTWFLEIVPVLIGVAFLAALHPRFRFTGLVFVLLGIHAVVLMIGGHYTYAEVPLFSRLRDVFHLKRNYYDRVGHFLQGFVPALIAREVLVRRTPLKPGWWLLFLVTCVCLAISASYEFFEWGVAVATGSAADAFLGTQGDPWDTQWDMFTALWGAVIAQVALGKFHDRLLREGGHL